MALWVKGCWHALRAGRLIFETLKVHSILNSAPFSNGYQHPEDNVRSEHRNHRNDLRMTDHGKLVTGGYSTATTRRFTRWLLQGNYMKKPFSNFALATLALFSVVVFADCPVGTTGIFLTRAVISTTSVSPTVQVGIIGNFPPEVGMDECAVVGRIIEEWTDEVGPYVQSTHQIVCFRGTISTTVDTGRPIGPPDSDGCNLPVYEEFGECIGTGVFRGGSCVGIDAAGWFQPFGCSGNSEFVIDGIPDLDSAPDEDSFLCLR